MSARAQPSSEGAGVALRVFIYIVVGHVLAGFLWLLFYIGSHSH